MLDIVKKIRILPRWIIVLLDLSVIAFSTLMGFLLRFNFEVTELIRLNFQNGILVSMICGLMAILITKSYQGIIRYTGLQDGVRIVYTTVLSMVLTFCASWSYIAVYRVNLLPNSVIIITFLASLLLLFYYRLVVKNIFGLYKNAMSKTANVAIFGAGQSGIVAKHVIDNDSHLKVTLFLEDDVHKIGKIIDGTKIHDARAGIYKALKEHNISQMVIAIKDLSVERKNEIVDICLHHHVKVRNVPPVEKWVRGELSLRQIKEVRIEDLLGRNIIQLDRANIKREILGKRVCITGAAGSIGSEIVRQVEQFGPKEIILIDQAESPMYELERELLHEDQFIRMKFIVADVTNEGRMRKIFEETRPEILFHAAAYKHVPLMEANPFEAIYTNVFGTKIVADLCVEYKVRKFVFISTDKAVNPTNVMGASKRIAEIYIQSLNGKLQKEGNLITSFVTTRFGNVLGSNGSVIPFFTKQIAYGGPVTVTHPEIARYFMTIPEACQLVLEAGAMGKGGEIYIFDMGKAVKVVELAKKMIMLSGLEPGKDIEIVYTGLREGEKLYEELLNQAENTIPTHHSKIMIARVPEITYNEAAPFMEKLYEKLSMEDEMGLVTLMKEMVPEYISNYSRFEVIDKRNRLGKAS